MYLFVKRGDHVKVPEDGLVHVVYNCNNAVRNAATGELLSNCISLSCSPLYQRSLVSLEKGDPLLPWVTSQPLTCLGCLAAD